MEEKRPPKTKEQILSEMKSNVEFQKRMKFVKEKFWPALIESSTSIEDAKMLLAGLNGAVMQSYLALMKDHIVKDLNLMAKLDAKSDKYLENQKLLELFEDMSVYTAKEYIEGMKNEVDTFIMDEMKTRSLSSLQVKWIDEL